MCYGFFYILVLIKIFKYSIARLFVMSKIVTLSEAASIALHSMVLIARSDKKLNVNEISEAIESSKHHVAKVMQRLAKVDFVKSNRGPSGGFVIKCDPKELSLLDIYEAIEGKVYIQACPGGRETCIMGGCILGDLSENLTREFKTYMESHFLNEYV